MAIQISKYIRQEKKTFNFILMSGGSYGCNILYEYGLFNGERFVGMRYKCEKYTEFEDDPDEKDGIGAMRPIIDERIIVGEFLNGLPNGECYEIKNGWSHVEILNYGIYEDGKLIQSKEGIPEGYEEYVFSNWEKMPVDNVEENGFSVLRKMVFYSGGDLRFEIVEGLFEDGVLNGFGTIYYNSYVNGYHLTTRESGIFKNGKLIFGFKNKSENTPGNVVPTTFDYVDGKSVLTRGEEIIYQGKRYIGEMIEGIPNGIGCLYESEEKLFKGTFKNGKLHGIGATYKRIEGKWVPYDFIDNIESKSYYHNCWGIFVNGEIQPKMTWEEFYDQFYKVKKV